nr:hypothetical protein [uncultured Brevundimonas sp.]
MTKKRDPKPVTKLLEDGIAPEKYNQVVDNATLVTIQLRKHDFDVKAEFYDPTLPKKLGFDRECVGAIYDAESRVVAATYQFVISAKAARRVVLKSVAEYLVMYEFEAEVDQQAAEAFCKRIGLYAAYPYYRALVSQLSAAANLNLPTLPMIATRGSRLPVASPAAVIDQ